MIELSPNKSRAWILFLLLSRRLHRSILPRILPISECQRILFENKISSLLSEIKTIEDLHIFIEIKSCPYLTHYFRIVYLYVLESSSLLYLAISNYKGFNRLKLDQISKLILNIVIKLVMKLIKKIIQNFIESHFDGQPILYYRQLR